MFPSADFKGLLDQLESELQTEDGLWTLRGFVDTARRVYSLTADTKVISKALELMLLPPISGFWEQREYEVVPAKYQNFYPDLSIVRADERYALDLKTTYRLLPRDGSTPTRVSGFTLGAFTGYFRHRDSTKNVTFPYGSYRQHYVVLIIYTQVKGQAGGVYPLERLDDIMPPIRDIEIFLQEKWRVASDRPGSGGAGAGKPQERILLPGTKIHHQVGTVPKGIEDGDEDPPGPSTGVIAKGRQVGHGLPRSKPG